MMDRTSVFFLVLLAASAACGNDSAEPRPEPVWAVPPNVPTYEVHEWGLVRGTMADRAMLSGPHATPPAVPLAKPVLYFHRVGGDISLDVSVLVPRGRIVEHWPTADLHERSVAWHGLTLRAGTCAGARYPAMNEPPCAGLVDGCEAAELARVETEDGDCVTFADGTRWDHLFYRAELEGTPSLPLRFEALDGGRLRVTNAGSTPIPGRILRLHHPGAGGSDMALAVAPPAPGASIELDAPTGPVRDANYALADSLRGAGLTEPEMRAFHRAWDETLFGATVFAEAPSTTAPVTATPIAGASPMPAPSTSVVYVLPGTTADGLATLSFTPAPSAVRRVIVAWIDEARF